MPAATKVKSIRMIVPIIADRIRCPGRRSTTDCSDAHPTPDPRTYRGPANRRRLRTVTSTTVGHVRGSLPASSVPAVALDSPTVGTADAAPAGAQPRLASDPAQLADDLVADELAIRDPSTPEPALVAAARRQQVAYRAIGRHPEWDGIIRPEDPGGAGRGLRPQRRRTAAARLDGPRAGHAAGLAHRGAGPG